jgi:hypothetical protein
VGDYLLFGQDRKVGRNAGGGINPMMGDAVLVEGGVKPGVRDEAAEFAELGGLQLGAGQALIPPVSPEGMEPPAGLSQVEVIHALPGELTSGPGSAGSLSRYGIPE